MAPLALFTADDSAGVFVSADRRRLPLNVSLHLLTDLLSYLFSSYHRQCKKSQRASACVLYDQIKYMNGTYKGSTMHNMI